MSLALGVIIGGAIGKVVSSLTSDVLMPVVSLVIPGGSWRTAEIALKHDASGGVVRERGVGRARRGEARAPDSSPRWMRGSST